MAIISRDTLRSLRNLRTLQSLFRRPTSRCLSTTSISYLKEIREVPGEKATVIEGVYVESPRADYVVSKNTSTECCYMCKLNLNIQHTDVLILSQFVDKKGAMLPMRVTGLCGMQHRIIEGLLKHAYKAGLVSKPKEPINDPIGVIVVRPDLSNHKRYFTGDSVTEKIREYR